jgi:hypothetical protein
VSSSGPAGRLTSSGHAVLKPPTRGRRARLDVQGARNQVSDFWLAYHETVASEKDTVARGRE